VLGEFFAALPGDIDDRLVEEGPYERMPTIEAKGLSEVTFATLGEMLGIGRYDDLVEQVAEGPQTESGEAGILTLPTELRDALATVEDIDLVAERWAATDELQDEWPPGELRDVLREVRQLARDARSSDRQLWYWWSL
jgi:hypothetical protein